VVAEHDHGFDVERDGHSEEDNQRDYDALTFTRSAKPATGKGTSTSGSLVLVTEGAKRATSLRGGTIVLSATRTKPTAVTLHVHTDKAFTLKDCNQQPCTSTAVAKGDSDVALSEAPSDMDLVGAGAPIHLLFDSITESAVTYPPPSLY